jgi:hypothetical protein
MARPPQRRCWSRRTAILLNVHVGAGQSTVSRAARDDRVPRRRGSRAGEASEIESVGRTARPGRFNREDIRMGLRAPDGPRVGHGTIGRLECGKPEPRSTRTSRWRPVRQRRHCRLDISVVAPQPFPGEERPVGSQQRRVGRRIAPVDIGDSLRPHRRRTAASPEQTYSPILGIASSKLIHASRSP